MDRLNQFRRFWYYCDCRRTSAGISTPRAGTHTLLNGLRALSIILSLVGVRNGYYCVLESQGSRLYFYVLNGRRMPCRQRQRGRSNYIKYTVSWMESVKEREIVFIHPPVRLLIAARRRYTNSQSPQHVVLLCVCHQEPTCKVIPADICPT